MDSTSSSGIGSSSSSSSSSTGDELPTSTGLSETAGLSTSTPTTVDVTTSTGTTGLEPICGDGMVDGLEACDDGNQVDGDACTNLCTIAVCGDGIKADDESCDDGDPDDVDECSNTCTLPVCGDGEVQGEEACDEGGETMTCDVDCTPAQCGDAALNQLAGEVCDDGNAGAGDSCSMSCEPTEIVSISVGGDHTCVAFKNGAMRCWGQGEFGALCNGTTKDLGDNRGELPVANINAGGAKVVQVASGAHHSCSRDSKGNVSCWGYGAYGQLGYGLPADNRGDTPDEVPRPQADIGTSALDVAAGGLHTCVIVSGNRVRCWGYGPSGQLGYGSAGSLYAPNKLDVPGIEGAVQLALGTQHTCVLQNAGEVRCWGLNNYGQLGLGDKLNFGDKPGQMPPPALDLGGPAIQIAAGGYHNCALMAEDKTVRCWGHGGVGQLGNGLSEPGLHVGDGEGEMPPVTVNLGGPVKQVVAGFLHTCALLETGKVECWGHGTNWALGYGSQDDIDHPGEFPPDELELGADAILLGSAAGYESPNGRGLHTCALLSDLSLHCWGDNQYGKLGYGHLNPIKDAKDAAPVPF